MNKRKLLFAVIVVAFLAVIVIGTYSLFFGKDDNRRNAENQTNTEETETTTQPPVEITLIAVGDNLLHKPLISEGSTGDGYNFDHFFTQISPYISQSDISVINQETIMGGPESGYSGYPLFNSPDEVGEAIVKAGFNVVLQASNHSADKGVKGINHALSFWKAQSGITMLGLNETPEEKETIRVIEVEGIRLALLNYTYSLNGLTLPAGQEHLVNIMDDSTREQVLSDITKANEMAEFVIVFPHWGVEYTNVQNENQITWANQMTDAGADLIIGAHPHVVQPVEWVQTETGNKSLCYYSLGNFLSNQAWLQSYGSATAFNTQLGGMAHVTIIKENGEVRIKEEGTGVYPIITHNSTSAMTTTYLLKDYNENLASTHVCRSRYGGAFSIQWLNDKSNEVFKEFLLQ